MILITIYKKRGEKNGVGEVVDIMNDFDNNAIYEGVESKGLICEGL